MGEKRHQNDCKVQAVIGWENSSSLKRRGRRLVQRHISQNTRTLVHISNGGTNPSNRQSSYKLTLRISRRNSLPNRFVRLGDVRLGDDRTKTDFASNTYLDCYDRRRSRSHH